MKKYLVLTVCMMLGAALFGCGKKSSLEGKIVDGKGQPLGGIEVVAIHQKDPNKVTKDDVIKVTTGSDGVFKFNALMPATQYRLGTYPEKYFGNRAIFNVESGGAGQTKLLPSPLVLPYANTNPDFIIDTTTGLQWARNGYIGGRPMSWVEGTDFLKNQTIAGKTGWRFPTKIEWEGLLKMVGGDWRQSLQDCGFKNMQNGLYWSSTTHYSQIFCVGMLNNGVGFLDDSKPKYLLAVHD
jgi:hypothetical protein